MWWDSIGTGRAHGTEVGLLIPSLGDAGQGSVRNRQGGEARRMHKQ